MTPRLIAISPGDCHERDRVPWFAALAEAGLRTLVLREPAVDDDHLDALLLQVWGMVPYVVVHDRHPRARHFGMPVHLPAHGDPTGLHVPWSMSCHDAAAVDRALALGASWVTLSPVWRPTSKPEDLRAPLGPDRCLAIAARRPVLALGGVTVERAAALASRGVGVAVCGPFFDVEPRAAAATCSALVGLYAPVSELSSTPTTNSRSS